MEPEELLNPSEDHKDIHKSDSAVLKFQGVNIRKGKKMAIGRSKFIDLAEISDFLVDKSLFIRDILSEESGALSITRPRRWGKSINLDMLRVFLEIDVDEEGNRLLNRNRKYFENLKINGEKRIVKNNLVDVMEHDQGKWPVISLSLSAQDSVERTLNLALRKAFQQHEYILRKEFKEELSIYNVQLPQGTITIANLYKILI